MKKILIAISIVTSSLSVFSQTFTSYYDKFDNYKRWDLKNNTASVQTSSSSRIISINATCYLKNDIADYWITIRYCATDWLFIEDGESLVFLLDGERMGLVTLGSMSNREVNGNGTISEEAVYHISKEQFGKIINASSIEMKLSGSNSFITEIVHKRCRKNLTTFHNAYVVSSPQELNELKIKSIDSVKLKKTSRFIGVAVLVGIFIFAISSY